MSWSIGQVQVMPGEDVVTKLRAAADDPERSDRATLDAAADAVTAGIAAAANLASVVTRDGDGMSINVSGHHNPDLTPVEGWADCTVYVAVSQLPQEKFAPTEN